MTPRAFCDYETRSACSLKNCGTWAYSVHPSTEILCLIYRLPHWETERTALWHPAFLTLPEHIESESLLELFDWIEADKLIEAHNVFFEYCIWNNIQIPRYGWPEIPLSSWRCSAAKAAAHALPRGLDDALTALKCPIQKDMEGHKLMLKMSKPRKSRKAEREAWAKSGETPPKYLWHESTVQLQRLVQYCRTDVLAEQALSEALPDLNPAAEQQIFEMDLRMNVRGFQLDKPAVKTALKLLHREGVLLNQELTLLTGRTVRKATQRKKMLEWFQNVEHIDINDTQKDTLDDTLKDHPLSLEGRHALEIVRALGRSSTAKYDSMRSWMARDGRVRGGLLYHGASTGRWAGKGVQPHNFPKGTLKDVSMETLWSDLKTLPRAEIATRYTSVMEALSNGLRGVITASKGCELHVADYMAIEARVVLWLAGQTDALQIFEEGRDIYCEMAESIYGYPCNKKEHPKERGVGKIAILGLGYQMGGPKFQATCETNGVDITEEFAQEVVDTYRAKFPLVRQLWWDQEAAAIQAVQTKRRVSCGKVSWFMQGRFLYCELPSKRRLSYPDPEIHQKSTPWGEMRASLTYMGIDTYTKKKWRRQTTYGGMLVENITQSIARDIMAEAMLRVDRSEVYQMVLSVHDEVVAEAPVGAGTAEHFRQLLIQRPAWGRDCPVDAEGWVGFRYHK